MHKIQKKRLNDSLLATFAMGIIIFSTMLVGVLSIIMKYTDFSLYKHMNIVQKYVFPLETIIAVVLYIVIILRNKDNTKGIINTLRQNPVFFVFTVMIILMVISQIYNGIGYALEGYFELNLGETFDMELGYFAFVLFIATQVKKEKYKFALIRMHLLSSLILVIEGFVLFNMEPENGMVAVSRPQGFSSIFGNRNYYGYFLAFTVPLTASQFIFEKTKLWKTLSGLGFLANTIALSINDCLGSWIGAFGGMLFLILFFLLTDKKINWQAIALLFLFMLGIYLPGHILGTFEETMSIFGSDVVNVISGDEKAGSAGSGRWDVWKATVEAIKDNKLLGVGFEGASYRKDIFTVMVRPHNEFLQYALFHGIPVAILYFTGCLGVFIRAYKRRRNINKSAVICLTAAFSYLVSSVFGLTVYSTAMYLFVFLGMGYINQDENTEDSKG